MTTTEAQIQRLVDLEEIREIRNRYVDAMFSQDYHQAGSYFTEDGVFEGLEKAIGPAAIAGFFEKIYSESMKQGWLLCSNDTTYLDGDTATGNVAAQFYVVNAESVPMIALTRYKDQLVRAGETWKFSHRKVEFEFMSPWREGFSVD